MPLNLTVKTRNSLRELARHCVPRPVYTRAARVYNNALCRRAMDASSWRAFRATLGSAAASAQATLRLNLTTLLHPISIRPGTQDATELIHSAIREAYGKYLPPEPVRFVIDAGAYIGDATAWYLSKFPQATVVALEPSPDVFPVLRQNCRLYGARAVPLNAALWPAHANLSFCANVTETGAFVKETAEGGTSGITPTELLDKYCPGGMIDIFKIDIEGAELQLFSGDCDAWLSRTRSIVVEIHGPSEMAAVTAAIKRHPFRWERYRETHVFLRQS